MVEFICETTVNHLGNFHLLMRMAQHAKQMGCDWIRVPRKDVQTFYPKEKLMEPYDSKLPYGKVYGEWRNTFELTDFEFQMFDKICTRIKLPWFSTVMDWPSFKYLSQNYHMPAYKIASCNARNKPYLKKLAEHIPPDKIVVISVGGSTIPEIKDTLRIFPKHPIYLLHCIAEYPTKPENARLGNIPILKEKFGSDRVTIGYSGHELGYIPSIVAAHLGADVIERHFTIQHHDLIPRIDVALEPSEFAEMINIIRSNKTLNKYADKLPKEAFEAKFGMSEIEESFLMEQKYKCPEK